MAYHFSANQFNDRYSPRKLGNWEYPKWYPDRPRQRHKSTKIIADDQGRLLDGIKRENAWGNYVGTWDLPKRITREYVKKLVAPPERLVKLWQKKKGGDEGARQQEPTGETEPLPGQSEEICKICEKLLRECTCGKTSKTKSLASGNEVEKCGGPLKCTKCNNEVCLCGDKCHCNYLPALDYSSPARRNFQRRNASSSALDIRPQPTTNFLPSVTNAEDKQTVRSISSLDERVKNILESVEEKAKASRSPPVQEICSEIKSLPKHSREKVAPPSLVNLTETKPEGKEYLKAFKEHLEKYEEVNDDGEEEPQANLIQFDKREPCVPTMKESPVVQSPPKGSSNVQIAKRYHEENLRHKPLPDVVDDATYKALTSGGHPNPGESLAVRGMPSAIGWKSYAVPGPTECSKLKVYRPKTAYEKVKSEKDDRPKTSVSKDQKSKRFLPIDLAICWDLKSDEPCSEPKISPHIDGSNGSAAPAVFTMIRPKEPLKEERNVPSSGEAMSEKIINGIQEDNLANLPSQVGNKSRTPPSGTVNKEAIMACIKGTSGENKNSGASPSSTNSISTNAAEYARQNPKTAWSTEDMGKALTNKLFQLQKENKNKVVPQKMTSDPLCTSPWDSLQASRKKIHQSTPNLTGGCCSETEKLSNGSPASLKHRSHGGSSGEAKFLKSDQKGRHCLACEKPKVESDETRQEKSEFKAAFKAGVPQSESSNSSSTTAAKSYKVPKMRLPYAKKSYSIGTLVPPFSLWPESKGQDYPEHWRLASVYQHSYKPINTRKRPMLASVYQ